MRQIFFIVVIILIGMDVWARENDCEDTFSKSFLSKIFHRQPITPMRNHFDGDINKPSHFSPHPSVFTSFDETRSKTPLKILPPHPLAAIVFARTVNALIDLLNTLMCREYFRKIRLPCSLVHPYFFPKTPIFTDDFDAPLEDADGFMNALYTQDTLGILKKE